MKMIALSLVTFLAMTLPTVYGWSAILLVGESTVQTWSPYDSPSGQLTPSLNDLLPHNRGAAITTSDGLTYFISGKDNSRVSIFNPSNNSTRSGNPLPSSRQYFTATPYLRGFMICGGIPETSSCLKYSNDEWSPLPDYPVESSCHAMITIAGDVFSFGGAGLHFLDTVYVLRESTQTWVQRMSIPEKKCSPGAVAWDDKSILVCGGSYAPDSVSATCFMYNTVDDAWTQVQSLNVALWGNYLVRFHDRIFCVGGGTDVVQLYDKTEGWQLMPGRLAQADFTAAAVAIQSPIIVQWPAIVSVGMWHAQAFLPTMGALDLPQLNDIPLTLMTGVVYNTDLHIIGGKPTDGEVSNALTIFNRTTQRVRIGPPLLRARSATAATSWGGTIMMCTGYNSAGEPIADCEQYEPVYGWSTAPPCPTAVAHAILMNTGDRPMIFGGLNATGHPTDGVAKYLYSEWIIFGPMPAPVAAAGGVMMDPFTALICGGFIAPPQVMSSRCHFYMSKTDTWEETYPLNAGRVHHSLTLYNDVVYCLGGYTDAKPDGDSTIEKFNKDNGWTIIEKTMLFTDRTAFSVTIV